MPRRVALDPETLRTFKKLYYNYRFHARAKRRPWRLSEKAFLLLTQKPCHYCGCPPAGIYTRRKTNLKGPFTYNGIDRLDPTGGYTPKNSVPCCGTCNYLKGKLQPRDFLRHLGRIVSHWLLHKI